MNIQETNQLLVRVQVVDNRQVGDSTVVLWHELLADVDYDVAVEAVMLHFRESTAYLVPARVRENATRILAAAHPGDDEWGNPLPVDQPARAALARLGRTRELGS